MEFHLPYYAWRRGTAEELRDIRNLRRPEEVIHLEMHTRTQNDPEGLKDFILEAQISVMVTGLDDWFVG